MIQAYKGQFAYQKLFVQLSTPEKIGVYYLGMINNNGVFQVLYVGKSTNQNGGIRARILEHIGLGEWPDITNFGYCICDTQTETENFEITEIKRLNPKYNQKVG